MQSCYTVPCGSIFSSTYGSSWWGSGACIDSTKACCDVGPAYGGINPFYGYVSESGASNIVVI